MNGITILGKYLDQPQLLNKFQKAVPAVLIGGGALYAYHNVKQAPPENRNKERIKNFFVLTATILSALSAPKIAQKLIKEAPTAPLKLSFEELKKQNAKLIDDFIQNNKINETVQNLLNKSKKKVLNIFETKKVFDELYDKNEGKKLLDKLIPDPENIDSKHIFSEIGRLSILGLIPVLGGITGGITGDLLTEKNWKQKIPDKIKEGSYQYLANIFLCNIGAAAALMILEKKNIQSKAARGIGMMLGIAITGIIGGSTIANFISNKVINPVFDKNSNKNQPLFAERTPEAIDIGLHADDIATVAVMSGLKWIEPALPIMYSISGYRSGIGYRNGEARNHEPHHNHKFTQTIEKSSNASSKVFLSFGNNAQK